MTLCISAVTPQIGLVASSTRASHTAPGTREWLGPREDRIGTFSNVRRVGGGAHRGGWAAAFGAPLTWCTEVFDALKAHPADDVDELAWVVRAVTERFADTVLGGRIVPPGEQHPERWPGGIVVVHPTPLGFGRATVYGNGEVWGREFFATYAPPIEFGTVGLPLEPRATFERALLSDWTLGGALRAVGALFHRAYELTGREAGSVGQLVEAGLLRTEVVGDRWHLRYDYLRPMRAVIIRDASDDELAQLVVPVDALPFVEATHANR